MRLPGGCDVHNKKVKKMQKKKGNTTLAPNKRVGRLQMAHHPVQQKKMPHTMGGWFRMNHLSESGGAHKAGFTAYGCHAKREKKQKLFLDAPQVRMKSYSSQKGRAWGGPELERLVTIK